MREQFMVDVYGTGAVIVRDNFAKGARGAWDENPLKGIQEAWIQCYKHHIMTRALSTPRVPEDKRLVRCAV